MTLDEGSKLTRPDLSTNTDTLAFLDRGHFGPNPKNLANNLYFESASYFS